MAYRVVKSNDPRRYSAKAIANYFLDLANQEFHEITPIQLQGLVYLAHGYLLADCGEPLVGDRIEVGVRGPIILELYNEFRRFGDGPIRRRALEWYTRRGRVYTTEPSIDAYANSRTNQKTKKFLSWIWQRYGGLGHASLSRIVFSPDSLSERRAQNIPIPNEWIKQDFVRRGLVGVPKS